MPSYNKTTDNNYWLQWFLVVNSIKFHLDQFSNDWRKTKTKAITPTNQNRSRQCDELITNQFLAITCNLLIAWEKSHVYGAFGFGFDSHWLKTGTSLLSQSLSVVIAIT